MDRGKPGVQSVDHKESNTTEQLNTTTYDPEIPLLGKFLEGIGSIVSERYLHTCVQNAMIHSRQRQTKPGRLGWMTDKEENMLYALWDGSSADLCGCRTPSSWGSRRPSRSSVGTFRSSSVLVFHLITPQKLVVPRDVMSFIPTCITQLENGQVCGFSRKKTISEARTLCLEFPGEGMSPMSGPVFAVRLLSLQSASRRASLSPPPRDHLPVSQVLCILKNSASMLGLFRTSLLTDEAREDGGSQPLGRVADGLMLRRLLRFGLASEKEAVPSPQEGALWCVPGGSGKKSERRDFLFPFWKKTGEKKAATAAILGGGRARIFSLESVMQHLSFRPPFHPSSLLSFSLLPSFFPLSLHPSPGLSAIYPIIYQCVVSTVHPCSYLSMQASIGDARVPSDGK